MNESALPAPSSVVDWLWRRLGTPPVIIAHRGASGLAPENTLAAFRTAIELGTPAVECDVHLAAGGTPVILHDDTLDRTTSGSGPAQALPFDQLRGLDAGRWFGAEFAGERIPTLAEALAVCAGRARLVVELKPGGGEALALAALDAIEAARQTDVAVISFDPTLVAVVARRAPALAVGLLVSQTHLERNGVAHALQTARNLGATFFSPQQSVVDEALVSDAHAAGLPVSVWTVDDPDRMRALTALGVDAITTNRPDIALGLFGRASC